MAVRYGALCAVLAGTTALALLAGCAVRPSPLTEQDTERRVAEDRRTLAANRPALDGPLTLHRAMAYALLFNLESRVRAMEQALALGELEVARLGLLPGLSARYGVTTRSNVRASSSRSVLTGRESLAGFDERIDHRSNHARGIIRPRTAIIRMWPIMRDARARWRAKRNGARRWHRPTRCICSITRRIFWWSCRRSGRCLPGAISKPGSGTGWC